MRPGISLSVLLCVVAMPLAATFGQAEPVDSINPFIGASTSAKLGEGKTFPGPATPFGLVQLSPDTITGGDNGPGYSYEHTTIEGFSFTHLSGVGWYGDFGNLLVMPTTGPLKTACGRINKPGEGYRSRFTHENEVAKAGYYAVTLSDYNVRAELTAAPHAGMLRFTFPKADQSRVQIDLARRIAGTSTKQQVTVVNDHAIEGWMYCPQEGGGWGHGNGHCTYTVYFHMEFSEPLAKFGMWNAAVPENWNPRGDDVTTDRFRDICSHAEVLDGCKEKEGRHLGFYTEFPTKDGQQVLVKAGISFVSIEGARANLQHDIPGWDFDAVHAQARGLWADALRNVSVEGGTPDQQTIFATAMYHAMIDPRSVSDVDGKYTAADGKVHQSDRYTQRTVFSGWDVFRAEFPLMTILNPKMVNDEINSLVELADLSGKGYLERWEIMNAYSGCMDGDPATSVIWDAYSKGIRNFDVAKAYAAMRQTAAGTGKQTNRPNNEFYMNRGYVPGEVSWTLDDCYYDWCVGRMAQALGKADDAKLFLARAGNYANIYDPQVQSMHAKDADGKWTPWRGKTTFGQGCTESNPCQQTWFVPHDVAGLIKLMGEKQFADSLEEFFEKTPKTFGWNAYYNHANEPVHHIAYLFTYAGKPWLTQKWVREILDNAHHAAVNGICGNDDVGQMSAWYVMSSLGFYQVCPGDSTYIIGSPLFAKATLHLDPTYYGGKTFTIIAKNNSQQNVYIQAATLNSRPLSRAWITHQEITAGGTLEFQMGPTPNETWGAAAKDRPIQ
jgi:predicted alpha-1,2-mannosidase